MKRLFISIFTIIISAFTILAQESMFFKEGTQWIVELYPDNPNEPDVTETLTLQSIPGAAPNILAVYTDRPSEYYFDAHCLNLKIEGEKVYFHLVDDTAKVPQADDKGWYLMYDFGLQLGETCEIYNANAMRFNNDPSICKVTLKYAEFVQTDEIGSLCNMIMEEQQYGERGVWIKGVGDTAGLLHNGFYGRDGGGSKLIGLICDGKEIFYDPSTSVTNIPDSPDFQVIKNGLTVTVSTLDLGRQGYVYSIDGKLVSVIDLSVSNSFTVQAPGFYILKIGDLTKKILLN